MHISPYEYGNIFNKDPLRNRKLLLNKREIEKLFNLVKQQGYSLIPISLYFKGSFVKIELGIGKGKNYMIKEMILQKKKLRLRLKELLKKKIAYNVYVYPFYNYFP